MLRLIQPSDRTKLPVMIKPQKSDTVPHHTARATVRVIPTISHAINLPTEYLVAQILCETTSTHAQHVSKFLPRTSFHGLGSE